MGETIREHYVPKGYLRKFSHNKKQVYCYDKHGNVSHKLIGVSDVCVTNNLYETKDETGEFVERGVLENQLQMIENKFYQVIKRIEKIEIPNEMRPQAILSSSEKDAIRDMVTLQILRTEQIIDLAIETAKEILPKYGISKNFKKYALDACLPFSPTRLFNESEVWTTVHKWTDDMCFIIGYDEKARIITNDHPVYIYHRDADKITSWTGIRPESITYPLTTKLVLYMYPRKSIGVGNRNMIFKMAEDDVNLVIEMVIYRANKWVIAPGPNYNEKIAKMVEEGIDIIDKA